MKNKNLIKGTLILSAFALVALGVVSVQAASEDNIFESFRRGERIAHQDLTEEEIIERQETRELRRAEADMRKGEMWDNRELIHNAIENGDYETWKELAPDNCPMIGEITEENFSELKDRMGQKEMGTRRQSKGFEGRGMNKVMMNK